MDWRLLLMALGLVFIIEGLPYFLFPRGALRGLRLLEELEPATVRLLGLVAQILGVALLLLGRAVGT
ncbi:MAG: DUF2065 family protein [Acidobacteriota bacterium]